MTGYHHPLPPARVPDRAPEPTTGADDLRPLDPRIAARWMADAVGFRGDVDTPTGAMDDPDVIELVTALLHAWDVPVRDSPPPLRRYAVRAVADDITRLTDVVGNVWRRFQAPHRPRRLPPIWTRVGTAGGYLDESELQARHGPMTEVRMDDDDVNSAGGALPRPGPGGGGDGGPATPPTGAATPPAPRPARPPAE